MGFEDDVRRLIDIFRETLDMANQHTLRFYELVYKIRIDKQRPFEFEIVQPDQRSAKCSLKLAETFKRISNRTFKSFLSAAAVIKEEFVCLKHGLKVEAVSSDPNCHQKWLCPTCLFSAYRLSTETR
jgi:hypothetical protein